MKTINLNTILLLTLIGLAAWFLVGTFQNHTDSNIAYYQQQISNYQQQEKQLYDSLYQQRQLIDSLYAVKQKKDTVWLIKIKALQQLNLGGQYITLKEYLSTSCELVLPQRWYYVDGDTLLALSYPELMCINTSFVERDMYSDLLITTEEILNATNKEVTILDSLCAVKDSIITYKDSVIFDAENVQQELETKLNRQKWFTRGAIGAAIGILIFK